MGTAAGSEDAGAAATAERDPPTLGGAAAVYLSILRDDQLVGEGDGGRDVAAVEADQPATVQGGAQGKLSATGRSAGSDDASSPGGGGRASQGIN